MELNILNKMLETIAENLQLMFQKDAIPQPEHRECNRPDFEDDFIGMISLANQSHQGQLIISISRSAVNDILEEVMSLVSTPEEESEMRTASLGELLNTVSGAFAEKPEVTAAFEHLDLTPYFCRSEGLAGHLLYGDSKINVFLSINPYKVFQSEEASSDSLDLSSFLDGDDLDFLNNL
jgi:CheY-specific phosphatase CheX